MAMTPIQAALIANRIATADLLRFSRRTGFGPATFIAGALGAVLELAKDMPPGLRNELALILVEASAELTGVRTVRPADWRPEPNDPAEEHYSDGDAG